MTYTVILKPNQLTFTVNPGETVLDAALRHGLDFPYSCHSGLCGTCKGQILQGEVSYLDPHAIDLHSSEQAEGYALFCSAIPQTDLTIYMDDVKAPTDIQQQTLTYQTDTVTALSSDIFKLWLKPCQSQGLGYQAGQYVELSYGSQLPRPFSIANAPSGNGEIELHIRHQTDNDFTHGLLAAAAAGEPLQLTGPYGPMRWHSQPSLPSIMLARGTGFAPLKAIIEQALSQGISQPIYLYWSGRQLADLYLHELAQRWAKYIPNFHYIPILTEPDPNWSGASGEIAQVIIEQHPNLAAHHVYACGPSDRITAAKILFLNHGLDAQLMYADAL